MIRAGAFALALALAGHPAGAFDLTWPLECTLGEDCFIQQYVDRDPGPKAQDFTCGPLVYDGHQGTDIALPSLAAQAAGVTVRAAAAGIVAGIRDEMPDILASAPGAPALEGRDCGNGVRLLHEGGWETQYCHLARGSILVTPGQSVAAGAPLGRVGLSGRTEFPHLHVTVRRDGAVVDPFDPDDSLICGGPTAPALWATPPAYQPGGIIAAGFDTSIPEFDALKAGPAPRTVLPAKAPALVIWAYLFGGRAGDEIRFRVDGPAGAVLAETVTLERTQAQLFRAVGKRLRAPEGWPQGSYRGTARLIRNGAEIDVQDITVRIEG